MAGGGGDSGMATPSETGGMYGGTNYPELDQRATRAGRQSDQSINIKQRVGSSDITLFTADETKGGTNGEFVLPSVKSLQFMNQGNSVLGVQVKLNNWTNATTENGTAHVYLQFLVRQGETINFPMSRVISSVADGVLSGTSVANATPDSNMYTDSTAEVDLATNTEIGSDATHTTLNVLNGESKLFKVGDLIRIENEICEVTALGTGADLANSTLTIKRGMYGSLAATHADTTAIRFAFFDAYHDFDGLTTARTDNDGKFKAFNFFGYGRSTDIPTSGIVPGSVAIKCYNPGYQELGLSGITPGTNSGLTAGETYYFFCNVDGGGAGNEVSFTVDANNTNFGGRNGVLSKIQDFFNQKYYTAGATLFEKKVTVGIVNGDIRFTSGSYLSTSSIALTAGTGGAGATVRWFGHATTPTGRIPGIDNIPSAVAASLPDDTVIDPATGNTISNSNAFMYDDGYGSLVGNGSGTINYDTGAIDFTSKPNAEFVVSAIHTGALAGNVTETSSNTIMEIKARSLNTKVEGKINVVIGG